MPLYGKTALLILLALYLFSAYGVSHEKRYATWMVLCAGMVISGAGTAALFSLLKEMFSK